MTIKDEIIETIAQAVGKMEGFQLDLSKFTLEQLKKSGIKYALVNGKPETVSTAYNNPGNIMGRWGNRRTSKDGFVLFENVTAGWNAVRRQISLCMDGYHCTFLEFFAGQRDAANKVRSGGYSGYAPAGHGVNNPANYASFIVDAVNKKFGADVKITDRMDHAADALAKQQRSNSD